MLDSYAAHINDLVTGIYDSIMSVEEQMLMGSMKDLTICELHIIEAVWELREKGCSVSDLAEARAVTVPSMTVAVKKLEKKGYVEKRRSETDGRMIRVALTRKGEKVNAVHRYFHRQLVRSFLTDIDEEARPVLQHALENMDAFLKRKRAEFAQSVLLEKEDRN